MLNSHFGNENAGEILNNILYKRLNNLSYLTSLSGRWTGQTKKIQRKHAHIHHKRGNAGNVSSVLVFGCTLLIWPVEGACVLQLNVEVVGKKKPTKEIHALRACIGKTVAMRFKGCNKKIPRQSKRK